LTLCETLDFFEMQTYMTRKSSTTTVVLVGLESTRKSALLRGIVVQDMGQTAIAEVRA
jgi:ribosome-interacting GTPase 1